MDCPACGAQIGPQDVRCRYCGNTIPQSAVGPPARQDQPLELLKQSKELEELLRYTPSAIGRGAGMALMVVFGLVFASFAIFFMVTSKKVNAPGFLRLFPLIFVLVGLGIVGAGLRGLVKLVTSPLQRIPAAVVGKRQHYSSGSRNSGSTSYYVTIRTEDGHRKEHRVRGMLFGELDRGDAGVAYIKGGYLIDFRPGRLPTT